MAGADITLRTLAQVPEEALVQALNAAYADYFTPIYLTVPSFRQLVSREDILPERSVAALCGDQIVGMGLLAVREARAWIGGLGVIPAFRRQGVGRQLMGALLGHAHRATCRRVQLEVITVNAPARALYLSLGFRQQRRLSVLFTGEGSSLPSPDAGLQVDDASPASLLHELPRFLAAPPPWQHEIDSMWAVIDRVEGLAARDRLGDLLGLCLWSGDETQAGVMSLAGRSPETGAALLAALRRRVPQARLAYLNVPEDDPMLPVLLAAGFQETLAQYEMIAELSQENEHDQHG
jgi:ribosomal protein S18 acetylase RimI-like enzyme